MRLVRWAPWVAGVFAGSPAVTGVRDFADAGITHKPCGHVITLRNGADIAVQWVRTSADTNEGHSEPEVPVAGEPPAPVTPPELPSSGRIPLKLVEEHLAALIASGANPEIRAVERKSTREDPGLNPCGLAVRMHSGADIFALFLRTQAGDEHRQGTHV